MADGKTVHVVFARGGKIEYRRSEDCGVSWGHTVSLTSGGAAQCPCSLELSGQTLHLIWPDSRNGTWEMYYKRSRDAGKTWGEDARLTPGVDLFRLGTAVSGTNVHAAWGSRSLLEKVPVTGWTWTWGEIYYKRSTDDGATWEKDVRLTQPDASAMRPGIAVSGQYVHVAWFDRRDAKRIPGYDWDIYYKRSTDGGATWGPDVRMSRTPEHSRHPQVVATAGGTVCCIWEDGQVLAGSRMVGDPALYAAVSRDNGGTWGKPQRITYVNAPGGFATHPKAYACGARVHLVWTDSPEGIGRPSAAYYMTSPDGGLTWGEPERLTSASDGECGGAAVGGTESYAIVLIGISDTLCYRRRNTGAPAPATGSAQRGQ